MCKLSLGETAKNVGNLQEISGLQFFCEYHGEVVPPAGVRGSTAQCSAQGKQRCCCCPSLPLPSGPSHIYPYFLCPEFLHRIKPIVCLGEAGEQQLPMQALGLCGSRAVPVCAPVAGKRGSLLEVTSSSQCKCGQPRSGDVGHGDLAGILLCRPLGSQLKDEWECGGMLGREGTCPFIFWSTSYQWIARLAGELWLAGSCRHWDHVMWLLSDCPLEMWWEKLLSKGFP